jgi:hypothetical protein
MKDAVVELRAMHIEKYSENVPLCGLFISDRCRYSAEQSERLVELQERYADWARHRTHILQALNNAGVTVEYELQNSLRTHDRHSLVKRVPMSLFNSKPPASLNITVTK